MMFGLAMVFALVVLHGYGLDDWCRWNNEEWCLSARLDEDGEFWMVIYRTWEKNHASPFRTLMYCMEDPDCNVPWHWKYDTRLFSTAKGAVQWANREFHVSPERFVALRRVDTPTELGTATTETQEVRTIKETHWSLWRNNSKHSSDF